MFKVKYNIFSRLYSNHGYLEDADTVKKRFEFIHGDSDITVGDLHGINKSAETADILYILDNGEVVREDAPEAKFKFFKALFGSRGGDDVYVVFKKENGIWVGVWFTETEYLAELLRLLGEKEHYQKFKKSIIEVTNKCRLDAFSINHTFYTTDTGGLELRNSNVFNFAMLESTLALAQEKVPYLTDLVESIFEASRLGAMIVFRAKPETIELLKRECSYMWFELSKRLYVQVWEDDIDEDELDGEFIEDDTEETESVEEAERVVEEASEDVQENLIERHDNSSEEYETVDIAEAIKRAETAEANENSEVAEDEQYNEEATHAEEQFIKSEHKIRKHCSRKARKAFEREVRLRNKAKQAEQAKREAEEETVEQQEQAVEQQGQIVATPKMKTFIGEVEANYIDLLPDMFRESETIKKIIGYFGDKDFNDYGNIMTVVDCIANERGRKIKKHKSKTYITLKQQVRGEVLKLVHSDIAVQFTKWLSGELPLEDEAAEIHEETHEIEQIAEEEVKELPMEEAETGKKFIARMVDVMMEGPSFKNNTSMLKSNIKYHLSLIQHFQKEAGSLDTNYSVANKAGTAFVYNSGYLSKFGRYIHIIAIKSKGEFNFDNLLVMESMKLADGFGIPISKLSGGLPLASLSRSVCPDIDKLRVSLFDFHCLASLEHALIQRRDRLPKKARDLPLDVLAECIEQSIRFVILNKDKMADLVLEHLTASTGKTAYMMPLWIFSSKTSYADATLLVARIGNTYSVRTILSMEMTYYNTLTCGIRPYWVWRGE